MQRFGQLVAATGDLGARLEAAAQVWHRFGGASRFEKCLAERVLDQRFGRVRAVRRLEMRSCALGLVRREQLRTNTVMPGAGPRRARRFQPFGPALGVVVPLEDDVTLCQPQSFLPPSVVEF